MDTKIQFKDENLKNGVLYAMQRQSVVDKSVKDITENDALKVTELNLDNKHISSLEGIEKFKNLTTLDLGSNQISDITPLKSLTNLSWLYLNHNKISDITPLKSLTNLKQFSADYQIITLRPESLKVGLVKRIKGFGNIKFKSDENIVNGVLTYKKELQNPYVVYAQDGDNYSVTIKIYFPKF